VPPVAIILLIIGLPVVLATAFVQQGVGGDGTPAPGRSPAEPTPLPDRSAPPASAGAPSGPGEIRRRLFTWRNAILGGAAAFATLAVLLGGWLVSRSLGIGPAATLVAQGVLDEQATILLADFDSDDANLSRAATEAFRIDLSQSTVVRLADPAFVREALTRMARPGDTRLTLDVARELAQREGLPAVLHGEILGAGGRYVVSASLLATEDGALLASHRETAADSSDIIDAIDATSNRLRERIGESLPDLRASTPLARVTTADLQALRQYSQAARLADMGEEERAIAFLEQAIQRDSTFAMAYRKLGVILNNRSEQRSRALAALGHAFAHRDRLTDRERYLTEAQYYFDVETDLTRAAAAYESLLELDPNDDWALNNVGIIYGIEQRDFARAEPMFERAIDIDTLSAPPYFNLAVVLASRWKLDAIDSTLALWARRLPADPTPAQFRALRAFVAEDWEGAEDAGRGFLELYGSNPALAANGNAFLANTLSTLGRLQESHRFRREAESDQSRRGLAAEALREVIPLASLELMAQDVPGAVRTLEAGLERYPLDGLDPLDRPYLGLVFFYVDAGRPGQARRILSEWEAAEPGVDARPVYWSARGSVEAAEGNLEEGVASLRRGDSGPCTPCTPNRLARAYDRAGVADSAVAYYEAYLANGMLFRPFIDATNRGPALERLGQLYDSRGDLENAQKYYAEFVELWAEADDVLQPRVRAAQARLDEILKERG